MQILRRTFYNLSSGTIPLGRAGENDVTRLDIDISQEQCEIPNATFELILQRPMESDPYPVLANVNGSVLSYSISGYDLGNVGYGRLELVVYGPNGEVKKSTTTKTRIESALLNNNQYPSSVQKWFDILRQKQIDIDNYVDGLVSQFINEVNTEAAGRTISDLVLQYPYGSDRDDYLLCADYSSENLDYAWVNEFFEERYREHNIGACSSVRNGNWIGRNYDWYYDNSPSIVVRTAAINGRHAVVGVAQYTPITMDKADARDAEDAELYRILPFVLLDGMNDAGVYANVNVTALGDRGTTTGTNPDGDNLCGMAVVRYVLDHADSAYNAIELLQAMNIWFPHSNAINEEFHFMISDKNDTYIVEFVDNRMVYHKAEDENGNPAAIMTNFSLVGADAQTWFDGTYVSRADATEADEFFKPTEHPMGVERFDILKAGFANSDSKNGMKSLMESVKYSQTYDTDKTPYWYSELSADMSDTQYGNLAWGTPVEEYEPLKQRVIELYESEQALGLRESKTWHTVHTSVYDIENGVLYLYTQENYGKEFLFFIDFNGNVVDTLNNLTEKSHTHPNKSTLDKLSVENGKLCYDGKEVGVKAVNELPQTADENTIVYLNSDKASERRLYIMRDEGWNLITLNNEELIDFVGLKGVGNSAEIFNCYSGNGKNTASGNYSHSEGFGTKASGNVSHSEGISTEASGEGSHAEGNESVSTGGYSHAEGYGTTASGGSSHAEGLYTVASGMESHAEGDYTTASGDQSHAEGVGTVASGNVSHVEGKYNVVDSTGRYQYMVGNGLTNTNRSNMATRDWSGNMWFKGDVFVGGTSQDNAKKLPRYGVESVSALPQTADENDFVYLKTGDRKGLYRRTANEWEQVTDDLLTGFNLDGETLKYGEKNVDLSDPDTLVPLTLQNYPTLVFRENLSEVPVYIYDRIGFSIELVSEDETEYIRYTDVTDVNGLPVPFLVVATNSHEYTCWFRDYDSVAWGYRDAGWYETTDGTETACEPPVMHNFTPAKFIVGIDPVTLEDIAYTDLSDLPPRAVSALRSLSQMVNVDAVSMGDIRIEDDAVIRFAGVLDWNRVYSFDTTDDIAIEFPTISWSGTDRQCALYIKTDGAIDISFPLSTKFYGGEAPAIEAAGTYKLIVTADPYDNVPIIGMLACEDEEVST